MTFTHRNFEQLKPEEQTQCLNNLLNALQLTPAQRAWADRQRNNYRRILRRAAELAEAELKTLNAGTGSPN